MDLLKVVKKKISFKVSSSSAKTPVTLPPLVPGTATLSSAAKHNNHHHHDHYHDHDRISITSLNAAFEDVRASKDNGQMYTTNASTTMRRSSMLRRTWAQHTDVPYVIGAHIDDENHGLCGKILLGISWFLIIVFFPFSLFVTIKVVQEYE